MILAGPGVNLLIAFVLFWGVLFAGSMNGALTLEGVNPGVRTLRPATTAVGAVAQGMPASGGAAPRRSDRDDGWTHGRRATCAVRGDLLAPLRRASPSRAAAARTPVRSDGAQVPGGCVNLSILPRYNAKEAQAHAARLPVRRSRARSFGALAAAGASVREMWAMTTADVQRSRESSHERQAAQAGHSIVGISQVTEQAVAAGPGKALVVIGYVSLVLAVLNLLPFLPLDGGHVLWAAAEKLRGRRVSLIAMWRFSSVGIALLLFLVVSGFSNDIGRLGG